MTTVNQAPVAHVRQIRELPGPSGWPVLGNALDVNPSTVHLKAEQWAREFGEAYRIRIASRKFVVLSNPETVAKILRDRPDGFGRTTRFSETAEELAFGGVLSSNGEAWKRQRPMVLSGLDPAHLKRFFPTLFKVTQRLASRWQGAATAGEPIDLQADLMRYTVDVTAGLALGTDINTIESKEEVIQEHLDKILPAFFKRTLAPIRYWRVFKLPSDRELDRHVNALRTAVQSFIAKARRRLDEEPQRREHPTNLIEAMLVAHETERDLTDEDVSRNVLTMLLAGEDTTANTLAWMIWLLHGKPDAKSRATEEVRTLLNGASQPVDLEQVSRLDFIEACAHETMRLKPVVPLQGIQAQRDTEVGGIFLPAGTVVWLLLRPGAVDERNFPDAKDFRPERWLSGMSANSAKRVAMPFGAGPRMCPGRYLALAEIKIVMAMLLGSFEIDRVTTPDGKDACERLALTMSPVGLKMHLRLRKSD
jgi:cytochrome P450